MGDCWWSDSPAVFSGCSGRFFVVPRYVKIFQEVKVPMPGLTLLVINGYPFVTAGLLLGALG